MVPRCRLAPYLDELGGPICRLMIAAFMVAVMATATRFANAATLYWDNDGSAVGNNVSGTNLGGSGTWNQANVKWWDGVSGTDTSWGAGSTNGAIFNGTAGAVTMGSTLPTGFASLQFDVTGYSITGSTLNVTGNASISDAGASVTTAIDSIIAMATSSTLSKNGGGKLILGQTVTTANNSGISSTTFNLNDGSVELNKTGTNLALTAATINVGNGVGAANSALLKITNSGTNQIADGSVLTVASDGQFDLNGTTETIGAVSSMTGGTISSSTSGAKLIWANTSSILTATGSNSISADMQLSSSAVAKTRTFTTTASADSLMVSGALSEFAGGAVSIVKDGAGVLNLSTANSYTGTTTISNGTLTLSGTGSISTANLIINGGVFAMSGTFGRSLNPGGGTNTFQWLNNSGASGGFAAYGGNLLVDIGGNNTRETFIWDPVSTAGTAGFVGGDLIFGSTVADGVVEFYDNINLFFTNAGTRNIRVDDNPNSNADRAKISGTILKTSGAGAPWGINKTGDGVLELTGTNTYDGGTTVVRGTLVAGANAPTSGTGAFGSSSGGAIALSNASSATTDNVALLTSGAFTIGRAVTVNSNNSSGTSTIGGEHTSGTSFYTGNITLNKDVFLTAAPGGQVDFTTGVISGAFNATVTGGGTVTLAGTNTFGGSGNSLTIQGGTTLQASTGANGGNTNIGSNNTALTFNNGTLKFLAGFDPSGRTVTIASGGATFDTNGNTVTFANAIGNSGTGSLTKTGTGSLQLAGANSYSGDTIITNGTLKLATGSSINLTPNIKLTTSGSIFDVSAVSGFALATNQVLSGIGTVQGSLSVSATSTISPGNSPGLLTNTGINATQTWASNGTYRWEINNATGVAGTNWDLISIENLLDVTATSISQFKIDIYGLTAGNSVGIVPNFVASQNYKWLIADAGVPVTSFAASKFSLLDSNFATLNSLSGGTFAMVRGDSPGIGGDNSQIYLTFTAIPEPGSLTLLLIGLGWLARRRGGR